MVLNGEYGLTKGILGIVQQKIQLKETKAKNARKKRTLELLKRQEIADNARKEKGNKSKTNFLGWSKKQLETYIQYKKQKGDPTMPKTMTGIKQLCVDLIPCPSPIPSLEPSDDKVSFVKDDNLSNKALNMTGL